LEKVSSQSIIESKKTSSEKYYDTKETFCLNGINLLDTFSFNKYVKFLGKPDSFTKSGKEIYDEFGYHDYNLFYGNNELNAGHGYLLSAVILEPKINFNNIQIGDDLNKIKSELKISEIKGDTINIRNKNDDILTFTISKNKIVKIKYFGAVL
jgi:hypothetical protein